MKKVAVRDWQFKKKTEAYEGYVAGRMDKDEYAYRLRMVDMVDVAERIVAGKS